MSRPGLADLSMIYVPDSGLIRKLIFWKWDVKFFLVLSICRTFSQIDDSTQIIFFTILVLVESPVCFNPLWSHFPNSLEGKPKKHLKKNHNDLIVIQFLVSSHSFQKIFKFWIHFLKIEDKSLNVACTREKHFKILWVPLLLAIENGFQLS